MSIRLAIKARKEMKMPEIKLLQNASFGNIRIIMQESQPWFVAGDVCDSNSEKNKYRAIHLQAAPRACLGALLIQKANVNTSRLSLADCAGNVQELEMFPIDYGFSACSSWDRTFYLGGKNVGNFYAFDTENLETRFSVEGFNASGPACIQGIRATRSEVLLSRSDGIFSTYSYSGKLNSSISLVHPQYPAASFTDGQYFYVNVLTKNGPEAWLNMYYYPWGGLFSSKQINFKVMEMYSPAPETILLFGNDAGGPRVVSFHVPTQTFSEHLVSMTKKITAVCQADANNYYFSTVDGIRWYQYDSQTTMEYAFGGDTRGLAYEDLSNRLFVARPLALETYFLTPFPGMVNTLPFTDSLVGFELLYNK